ncbi:MAG: TIGR03619 family F420-dependent LLM class oxidoreductase [Micrococcales bacterium]|nr:TIGR03619 family F420-dependent LLM class oxidoreductase [Micrococcales bacterium]
MPAPRALMILTENDAIVDGGDLDALVEMAVVAEEEGVDGVMLSEHVVLGPSAGALGLPDNARAYAAPGNQDPAMPWPNSLVLLSAMAARTSRLRLVAGAVITPLRHPLLVAKEYGTLDRLSHGRLVLLPTVSWHEEEYRALGVDFRRRGRMLDEQLAAWQEIWSPGPATFHGEFYDFEDAYVEPRCHRPDGPRICIGGSSMHDKVIERLVRYGHAFNPFGAPTAEGMARLREAMTAAGRDIAELELVGGVRADLPEDGSPASLDRALATVPPQLEQGFSTICVKPSMFIDSLDEYRDFCRQVVAGLDALA